MSSTTTTDAPARNLAAWLERTLDDAPNLLAQLAQLNDPDHPDQALELDLDDDQQLRDIAAAGLQGLAQHADSEHTRLSALYTTGRLLGFRHVKRRILQLALTARSERVSLIAFHVIARGLDALAPPNMQRPEDEPGPPDIVMIEPEEWFGVPPEERPALLRRKHAEQADERAARKAFHEAELRRRLARSPEDIQRDEARIDQNIANFFAAIDAAAAAESQTAAQAAAAEPHPKTAAGAADPPTALGEAVARDNFLPPLGGDVAERQRGAARPQPDPHHQPAADPNPRPRMPTPPSPRTLSPGDAWQAGIIRRRRAQQRRREREQQAAERRALRRAADTRPIDIITGEPIDDLATLNRQRQLERQRQRRRDRYPP